MIQSEIDKSVRVSHEIESYHSKVLIFVNPDLNFIICTDFNSFMKIIIFECVMLRLITQIIIFVVSHHKRESTSFLSNVDSPIRHLSFLLMIGHKIH